MSNVLARIAWLRKPKKPKISLVGPSRDVVDPFPPQYIEASLSGPQVPIFFLSSEMGRSSHCSMAARASIIRTIRQELSVSHTAATYAGRQRSIEDIVNWFTRRKINAQLNRAVLGGRT
jgi:hypothetical protein